VVFLFFFLGCYIRWKDFIDWGVLMTCSCEGNGRRKSCIEMVPIFSTLTYDEMMEVARITVARSYKKGELIYMAGDKGEVVLNMSKGDLASHIGMSQKTLSRKLSYFQDMGWIKQIRHRRIVILDEENLRSLI